MKICDMNTCNMHASWVLTPKRGLALLMLLATCKLEHMYTEILHMYGIQAIVAYRRHSDCSNCMSFLIQYQNAKLAISNNVSLYRHPLPIITSCKCQLLPLVIFSCAQCHLRIPRVSKYECPRTIKSHNSLKTNNHYSVALLKEMIGEYLSQETTGLSCHLGPHFSVVV